MSTRCNLGEAYYKILHLKYFHIFQRPPRRAGNVGYYARQSRLHSNAAWETLFGRLDGTRFFVIARKFDLTRTDFSKLSNNTREGLTGAERNLLIQTTIRVYLFIKIKSLCREE